MQYHYVAAKEATTRSYTYTYAVSERTIETRDSSMAEKSALVKNVAPRQTKPDVVRHRSGAEVVYWYTIGDSFPYTQPVSEGARTLVRDARTIISLHGQSVGNVTRSTYCLWK
jgi:hypothetical protein